MFSAASVTQSLSVFAEGDASHGRIAVEEVNENISEDGIGPNFLTNMVRELWFHFKTVE